MDALLVLEDGRSFPGRSFGAAGERVGEVVFHGIYCALVQRIVRADQAVSCYTRSKEE